MGKIIGNYITTKTTSTVFTLIRTGYVDDANDLLPNIGFDFPFYGTNYRSNIYVGTNSYVTFGFASSEYQNFSATNPGRGIYVAASDNGLASLGGYYYNSQPGIFTIRYKGTNRLSGTSAVDIDWDVILFSSGNIRIIKRGMSVRSGAYNAITRGDNIKFTTFSPTANETLNFTYNSTTQNYDQV